MPAPSSGGPQSSAAEQLPQENRSLQQQVGHACRLAGFASDEDRHRFVKAVTGKESGSKLNRAEALSVIEAAGAVQRGEVVVKDIDGAWMLVTPESGLEIDEEAGRQQPVEGELNIPGLGVIRPGEA